MCESSLRILDLKIAVAAEVARPAAVAAEALATTQKGAAAPAHSNAAAPARPTSAAPNGRRACVAGGGRQSYDVLPNGARHMVAWTSEEQLVPPH